MPYDALTPEMTHDYDERTSLTAVRMIFSVFGYVPNVMQTETARLGIRLFFGLVPAIAIILSLPLLIWYPVTRASHAQLRAELNRG